MRNKNAAILDIGSSKLHMLVGERGLNNTFIIKSSTEMGYEGFSDGSFFNPELLPKVVEMVVKKAKTGMRKVDTLYVGVPGEFIDSLCKYYNMALPKRKRVTDEDIEKLYATAFTPKSQKYKLIARSPVYYVLSGNRKTTSPKGQVSDTLGGLLTYYMCEVEFLKFFDSELKALGIKDIKYFPSSLAEVLFLFEPYERDNGGILLDVGYLTSSFSYYSGKGILYQKSFSLGGGHITAKFVADYGLRDVSVAEKLKRMVNVSYNPFSDACYEIENGNNMPYSFSVAKANAAVLEVLDALAEQIVNCIQEGVVNHHGNLTISLTGGGISYIRGAKEYLSSRLGAEIKVVAPRIPLYDKPINSSSFSLMDYALDNQ